MPAPITPDDLYEFRWVEHVRIEPGGARIAFQVGYADREAVENRAQLHVADLAGGGPRQVTAGRRDRAPEWSPEGGRIAFTSRRGARDQVHVLDLGRGGDAVAGSSVADGTSAPAWTAPGRVAFLGSVTGDPDAVVEDPRAPESADQVRRAPVARIARRLDYRHDGAGYGDGRYQHLFVAGDEPDGARQLTSGAWSVTGFSPSPDGSRFAVTGNPDPGADLVPHTSLLVVGEGAEPLALVEGMDAAAPSWSPDGRWIAFLAGTASDGGRHMRVWVVPAGGGEARCLTRDFDRNVAGGATSDMRGAQAVRLLWTADSARLWFLAASPGGSDICSAGLEGDVRVEVAGGNRAIFDFDVREGVVAFCATDPWSPGDLYVVRDGAEVRLSEFNPWLRERDVRVPEKHVFRAADGLEIDGWLITPPGFDRSRKWPLVMEIHGGPHGQYGWTFFHEFQVLASMGMLVFFTNPRGSDGKGEEFKRAVVRDWGGADYEDLMSALDQLIERTGFVDESRLGVGGGSYGGYMTNWIIGQTDRFAAAVSMRSISNLVSEYAQHDIVPWGRNELGEPPWSPNFDELWRRSPIRYVERMTTPLLLTHGEMDLRCAISQAEELFGSLRLLGREVELVRFPGESHELSRSGRPDRRVERLARIAGWFGRHLLDAGTGAQP